MFGQKIIMWKGNIGGKWGRGGGRWVCGVGEGSEREEEEEGLKIEGRA